MTSNCVGTDGRIRARRRCRRGLQATVHRVGGRRDCRASIDCTCGGGTGVGLDRLRRDRTQLGREPLLPRPLLALPTRRRRRRIYGRGLTRKREIGGQRARQPAIIARRTRHLVVRLVAVVRVATAAAARKRVRKRAAAIARRGRHRQTAIRAKALRARLAALLDGACGLGLFARLLGLLSRALLLSLALALQTANAVEFAFARALAFGLLRGEPLHARHARAVRRRRRRRRRRRVGTAVVTNASTATATAAMPAVLGRGRDRTLLQHDRLLHAHRALARDEIKREAPRQRAFELRRKRGRGGKQTRAHETHQTQVGGAGAETNRRVRRVRRGRRGGGGGR
jgi:hypothetical protein